MKNSSLILSFVVLTINYSCQKNSTIELDSQEKDIKTLMSITSLATDFEDFIKTDFDAELMISVYEPFGDFKMGTNAIPREAVITGGLYNATHDGVEPISDIHLGSISFPDNNNFINKTLDISTLYGTINNYTIYNETSNRVLEFQNVYFPNWLRGPNVTDFPTSRKITWEADPDNELGIAIMYSFQADQMNIAPSTKPELHWIYLEDDDGEYTFNSSDLSYADPSENFINITVYRGNYARAYQTNNPSDLGGLMIIQGLSGTFEL